MTARPRGDWFGTLASMSADLVGGRVAIVAHGLLKLRKEVRPQPPQAASGQTSGIVADLGDPNTLTELGLGPEDAATARFLATLHRKWAASDYETVDDFVTSSAVRLWQDAAELRDALARTTGTLPEIRLLLSDAGVMAHRVDLEGAPEVKWQNVLRHMRTQAPGLLLFLVFLAHQRHPAEPRLSPWP